MLSYGAWQKRYGGRSNVLGQKVILDGLPNIIIGVLPRSFHFAPAEPADFWTALHAMGQCDVKRSCSVKDAREPGASVNPVEALQVE
jgi:hypothetical protein